MSQNTTMINLVATTSFLKWCFNSLPTIYECQLILFFFFAINWFDHFVDFNYSVFIILALIFVFLILEKLSIFSCLVAILISYFVKCRFVCLSLIFVCLFAFSLLIIELYLCIYVIFIYIDMHTHKRAYK